MFREDSFLLFDVAENDGLIFTIKGRLACHQLEQQHTVGPPVSRGSIRIIADNLKRGKRRVRGGKS